MDDHLTPAGEVVVRLDRRPASAEWRTPDGEGGPLEIERRNEAYCARVPQTEIYSLVVLTW
ncbi:MAG: hypothetical protein HY321_04125 [Armatimonadetes bacterium]|nr:hypothetical protein [Armatimonadota bacterium]